MFLETEIVVAIELAVDGCFSRLALDAARGVPTGSQPPVTALHTVPNRQQPYMQHVVPIDHIRTVLHDLLF